MSECLGAALVGLIGGQGNSLLAACLCGGPDPSSLEAAWCISCISCISCIWCWCLACYRASGKDYKGKKGAQAASEVRQSKEINLAEGLRCSTATSGQAEQAHLLNCPNLELVQLQDELGQGAFGTVHRGSFQGEQVAVKVLPGDRFRPSEWDILSDLSRHRHPHILSARTCFWVNDTHYFVSELILGSDLETFLFGDACDNFAEELRFQASQTVQALEFLHNNMIGHFDLKGTNLLVDRSRCVNVIDFGMAEVVNTPLTARKVSTAHYLSCEIMLTNRQVDGSCFGLPADVWSLGVTLYYLWTGCLPFAGEENLPFDISCN